MSRIGRMPVVIPAGTEVTVADGNVVTVKGKLGTLTQTFNSRMIISQEGNTLTVSRPSDEKEDRALHGLTRTLIHNMVVGVSDGYEKKLEIVGVGYRARRQVRRSRSISVIRTPSPLRITTVSPSRPPTLTLLLSRAMTSSS